MTELEQYSFEKVKKVNKEDRTVFVIYDKVYDVTSFLNEHPGGEEILLDHAGKDASEDFTDVGHSTDAIDLMKKYVIGEIIDAEKKNYSKVAGWKVGHNEKNSKNDASDSSNFFILITGAVIMVAVAYLYLL